MLAPHPRHFLPDAALPGAGLPGDRMARLAARTAFVELKLGFIEAVGQIRGRDGDWLRQQVRHAEEPVDLWMLRGPLFDALSVEDGLARTLGLAVGDRLRFDIGGVISEARITSLRKVDWGSMRANFFVMYPVASLADVPATYMASFRAPETPGFDNRLVRAFPNVTNVDMSSTINQVQRVLDQVIRVVEFLFAFTLAAGLVVLFAAVTATREERAREFAIMRAMGARASLLRQVQRAELVGVGLLAGFLASCVAVAVGWALARYVFDFAWTAALWVPLAGALAGAVLALAAGWWGLRDVLNRPVVETLRRAAE